MSAGDWIKMTVKLRTHPKVVRIASALKADKLRVIGALYSVWTVFDQHSADGRLDGYTLSTMDVEIGWKGFSAAMAAVGWLGHDEAGLIAPEFDEHNSKSAKRRALDTDRKKSARDEDESANGSRKGSGSLSASKADKSGTRIEEKRKKKPPIAPQGGEPPRASPVGLKAWMAEAKDRGEQLIPDGDPVFEYADKVGLPHDFLHLAWKQFRRTYTGARASKRYRDWRQVFRNAVEGNWLKLWRIDGTGEFVLTTEGEQAKRINDGGAQ